MPNNMINLLIFNSINHFQYFFPRNKGRSMKVRRVLPHPTLGTHRLQVFGPVAAWAQPESQLKT